jgi:ATP-dependent Clp protease, protease subunit
VNSYVPPDLFDVTVDRARSLAGAMRPESRYIIPEFRERTSTGDRIHNPYTKLFEERIIFLGVQIDDVSANDVMAQLLTLESMDPDRDIQLYINSPGGSFTALTAIYDTMQFIRPEVQTICMGQAASAAAVILAAGAKGKRIALPNSRILIHQPSAGFQGQSTDIEIHAREILNIRERIDEIYAKHTNKPTEEVRRDMERDRFFTAEQAKDYGLIDRVLESH